MPTETAIRTQIAHYLRGIGARPIKYHGGPMSETGIPDLLVCYRGRFVYIETKRPGEHPTPIQIQRMAELDKAGAIGGVATRLIDAMIIIDLINTDPALTPA